MVSLALAKPRWLSASHPLKQTSVDAYWIAYDVVFGLCAEFLHAGVSTILDLNMGWAFQWQQLDALKHEYSDVRWLPIVLRCSREICLQLLSDLRAWDGVLAGLVERLVITADVVAKFAIWTEIVDYVLAPLGGRQSIAKNNCACALCQRDLAMFSSG